MISGRDALRSLQQALDGEQQRLRQLDERLSQSNEQLLKLDSARNREVQTLARLRLQHLSSAKQAAVNDDTDRAVLTLLSQRNEAYNEVQTQLAALAARRDEFEQRSADLNAALSEAIDAVNQAEAATQERLEGDPDYQKQLTAAHDAARIAEQADAKAAQSEAELGSKGTTYRADPLFMYLWNRRYGTTEYRPGGGPFAPLIRYLDGKVARLVSYQDARTNFTRLQELPERLREHATRVQAEAEAAYERLKELDIASRDQDGVPALEAERDEAQRQLDALREEEAQLAVQHDALLRQLESFAQGGDRHYQQAVELLQSELDHAPLEVLRSEALSTPSPDDDLIVARLRDLAKQREQLAQTVSDLQSGAQQNRHRVRELEQIRQNFTSSRMDAPNSVFNDGRAVATALSQFLAGMLTAEALWRILNSQRSVVADRSDPNFGSGGFGRGTMWGGGAAPRGGPDVGDIVGGILGGMIGSAGRSRGSSGRGGSFRPSSGGSKPSGGGAKPKGGSAKPSKGGFRTGGKVGGGKFKTGGKF